jgi:hypothetical protein
MRITLENFQGNIVNSMRRAGYAFLRRDEQRGDMSFVKRISNGDYPRFHVFVRAGEGGRTEINLHLDQKKASYQGSHAHSGEYGEEENKWLEVEAEAIKREFI